MSHTRSRRIRRSRDEWQRLIDEQAGSGQTQGAFCAARGISVASLQNWKRRLAATDTAPAQWLEIGTLAEARAAWDPLSGQLFVFRRFPNNSIPLHAILAAHSQLTS